MTIADIIAEVARYYRLTPKDITGECRQREYTSPRQMAMYLARKVTGKSLAAIGRQFGNRDHTTVLHAVRVVERRIATDSEVRGAAAKIAPEFRLPALKPYQWQASDIQALKVLAASGLTQQEIAKKIGRSPNSVRVKASRAGIFLKKRTFATNKAVSTQRTYAEDARIGSAMLRDALFRMVAA